jgi:hypothetical protein
LSASLWSHQDAVPSLVGSRAETHPVNVLINFDLAGVGFKIDDVGDKFIDTHGGVLVSAWLTKLILGASYADG